MHGQGNTVEIQTHNVRSKRMRINRMERALRNQRRVQAASCEFKHGLNLLPGYMELLDNFVYARTCLKVFKDRSHGHAGITKHPSTAASTRHAFDGGAF